jgi:hypothetical protein
VAVFGEAVDEGGGEVLVFEECAPLAETDAASQIL